jgi:PKD repeat protein
MHRLFLSLSLIGLCLLFAGIGAISLFAQDNVLLSAEPGDVVINEIVTDPQHDWSTPGFSGEIGTGTISTVDEYIELYNASDRAIDLREWYLRVEDSTVDLFLITAGVLYPSDVDVSAFAPGAYLVVGNPPGAMNNDVLVELFDGHPNDGAQVIDSVALGSFDDGNSEDNAPNGNASDASNEAMSRDNHSTNTQVNRDDFRATYASPGVGNSPFSHAPVVIIDAPAQAYAGEPVLFDASDSYDEDGDEITISWDADDRDGIQVDGTGLVFTHTYTDPGTYVVSALATDATGLEGAASVSIEILPQPPTDPEPPVSVPVNAITITELLPNPVGDDMVGEFIELYNASSQDISLHLWKLDDEEGGSKPYTFPADRVIPAKTYIAIYRPESKLALNNGGDSARLFDPSGVLRDEVSYQGQAREGESYSMINGEWVWTTSVTPARENILTTPDSSPDDPGNQPDSPSPSDPDSEQPGDEDDADDTADAPTRIRDAKALDARTVVTIEGIVSVAPGEISASYFFIQDDSAGIKIYSSKKDFPDLARGQTVRIQGRVSHTTHETRILTSVAGDVSVLPTELSLISPSTLALSAISADHTGSLVHIQGSLGAKTSATITLHQEDTSLRVRRPKGLELPKLTKKEQDIPVYAAVGVVLSDANGYYLQPRTIDDVGRIDPSARSEERTTLLQSGPRALFSAPLIFYIRVRMFD